MKMQPCETNMFHAAHSGEDTGQQAQVDAELVLLQTGCDFGMRMGVDIGIDPQGHPRRLLPFGRQPVDDPQFGQRFDVEACDVVFQPQPDLPVGLSHTGKDNFRRREAARQRCFDLSAAHAVGTEPARRDSRQDVRVGIGLDGIMLMISVLLDLCRQRVERLPEQSHIVIIKRCVLLPELLYRENSFDHATPLLLCREITPPMRFR